jgi:gamma-glutamyl hydrolase
VKLATDAMTYPNSGADTSETPVIGALTQTLETEFANDTRFAGYNSYIMVGYVNFMESAGARVVPLILGESEEVTLDKLSKMNGVLMPGGGGDYYEHGKYIYDTLKSFNDNGTYYPLWGTCLGNEMLASYAYGSQDVLGVFDSHHLSIPLKFTKDPRDTKMFGFL